MGHNVKLTEHEGLTAEVLKQASLTRQPNRHNRLWHMDLSDSDFCPEISAMYMVQPAGSGFDDTLFARCANLLSYILGGMMLLTATRHFHTVTKLFLANAVLLRH